MAGSCSRVLLVCGLALLLTLPVAAQPAKEVANDRVRILIEQLGDKQFRNREKAGKELAGLGLPALEPLRQAAKSNPDEEIRMRAAALILRIETEQAERIREEKLLAVRKEANSPLPAFDAKRVKTIVDKAGNIEGNVTWTADKTYRITDELRVTGTLTLEPGVIVLVENQARIMIQAGCRLVAKSDKPNQPIIFTATAEKEGKEGNWQTLTVAGEIDLQGVQIRRSSGILFKEVRNRCRIRDVGIYATRGTGLSVIRGQIDVVGLTIRETSETALNLGGSGGTYERLNIFRAKSGIVLDIQDG